VIVGSAVFTGGGGGGGDGTVGDGDVAVGVPGGCGTVGVVGVPADGTGDDGLGLGFLTQRWTLM
jgi:hypothetical protein